MKTGVLDTLKIKFLGRILEDDYNYLSSLKCFRLSKNIKTVTTEEGDVSECFALFHDDTTGLRVFCTDKYINVEVSLPRIMGLENINNSLLTDDLLEEAFFRITTDILKYSSEKYVYGITRMDIARNFYCDDFVKIIRAYSHIKHPSFRYMPNVIAGSTLEYSGSNKKIVIYDKALEYDSKFKVCERKLEPLYNKLGRVELRYLNRESNEKNLIKDLNKLKNKKEYKLKTTSFPFLLPNDVVKKLKINNEVLFDLLVLNIEKLGNTKIINEFKNTKEIQHLAYFMHPELFEPLIRALPRTTRARFMNHQKHYVSSICDVELSSMLKLDFDKIAV